MIQRPRYDAFISYSHAADGKLAPALQEELQRFAKPWYRMRALYIFRDQTSLAATPELWPTIEQALAEAAYFILLASTEAAHSAWVQQEVEWWITNRSVETLLLAVTNGDLAWDPAAGDFDWNRSNVLPPCLHRQYQSEPLYVDLRFARAVEHLTIRHSQFRAAVLDLAAPIHGRPKDELDSEEVRQYNRFRLITRMVFVTILALALTAGAAAYVAIKQMQEAQRQTANAQTQQANAEVQTREAQKEREIAVGRQLESEAELTANTQPNSLELSVLLAAESLRRTPSVEAAQTLRHGLSLLPHPIARLSHNARVNLLTFSPRGEYLATATERGRIGMWEMLSGRELSHINVRHDDPSCPEGDPNGDDGEDDCRVHVNAMAFSPDGAQLATADDDGHMRIWDVGGLHEVDDLAVSGFVNDLAFSADGRFLAGASRALRWVRVFNELEGPNFNQSDDSAHVWDVVRHRELSQIKHPGGINRLAFSPDGKWLATAGDDRTVRISTIAGHGVVQLKHDGAVTAVVFSPDGRYVATSSGNRPRSQRDDADDSARIWQVANGREISRFQHDGGVNDVVFSPDGNLLATASDDGTARVWTTGAKGHEIERLRHNGNVNTVGFSSDGRHVLTASDDDTARLWDVADGRETARFTHGAAVATASFSPDGQYVGTASWDGNASLWSATGGLEPLAVQHDGGVNSVAFSTDGTYLLTARGPRPITSDEQGDETARLWNAATGQEALRIVHPHEGERAYRTAESCWEGETGHAIWWHVGGGVATAVLSPDGQILATLADDKIARLWATSDGHPVAQLEHPYPVTTAAFAPDGRVLATAGDAGVRKRRSTFLWQVDGAKLLHRIRHQGGVTALRFSPDGTRLAIATSYMEKAAVSLACGQLHHVLELWDTAGTKANVRLTHENAVTSIAFSPDGKTVVTASGDSFARLWDVERGAESRRFEHDGEVMAVDFSTDGHYVATASTDRNARVWDTETGLEVMRIPHAAEVTAVAFSPDGASLATAAADRRARIWLWRPQDLLREVCTRVTRNLSEQEWHKHMPAAPYRKSCPSLPN